MAETAELRPEAAAGLSLRRVLRLLIGGLLIAAALVMHVRLAVANRDVAPSGSYGQLFLDSRRSSAAILLAASLVMLAATGIAVMLPGRRKARWICGLLCAALAFVGAWTHSANPSATVTSVGVGCVYRPTFQELRQEWDGRPTVGELLSAGIVQGHVLDDPMLLSAVRRDPDAGGCSEG